MNTFTTPPRDADVDAYPDETTEQLPRRRRRQFLTRRSAALGALATCAIGFYAGIRVEKGQLGGSSAPTAAGTGALTGRSGAGTGSRAGLASLFAGRGGAGGATGGPGGAAANPSFGTVASVSGKTVYVTEASGNTVKVTLSSATKVSKTQSVSHRAIHPGDTVVVQGVSGAGGTVTAASVTDSGTRSGGVGGLAGAGSGSTGGSGSGKSGVSSLFSSGG
jgi:hypothetical protein